MADAYTYCTDVVVVSKGSFLWFETKHCLDFLKWLFKTGSALSKLNKDDLIRISLDMQKFQNSILSDMKNELSDNELSELRKKYIKLEADVKVFKSVTEAWKNHIIILERKWWSNEQYSRQDTIWYWGWRVRGNGTINFWKTWRWYWP